MPELTIAKGGAQSLVELWNGVADAVGNATPNQLGAWTEVVAATPCALDGLWFEVELVSAANGDFLMDLGIGPASSEQVLAPQFLFSGCTHVSAGLVDYISCFLPMAIPRGARLTHRVQTSVASARCRIERLYGLPASAHLGRGFGHASAYGASTGDSGGTQLDPGAVASTWGSWTAIASSIARPILALAPWFGNQGDGGFTAGAQRWGVELGTGPNSGAVTRIPDCEWLIRQPGANGWFQIAPQRYIPVVIPAGANLWGRCYCTGTTAGQRLIDVVVSALD